MNLFTASKRLTSILAVLAGFGIQAEDEKTDIAAAIQTKIDEAKASTDVSGAVQAALEKEREAHADTTAVLRHKAEMFDALDKQAKEAGLDLAAMATAGGMTKVLEDAGREEAKKALGLSAPPPIEATVGQDALPVGFEVVAKYQQLDEEAKKGDPAAKKARDDFFQAHADEILPHINALV